MFNKFTAFYANIVFNSYFYRTPLKHRIQPHIRNHSQFHRQMYGAARIQNPHSTIPLHIRMCPFVCKQSNRWFDVSLYICDSLCHCQTKLCTMTVWNVTFQRTVKTLAKWHLNWRVKKNYLVCVLIRRRLCVPSLRGKKIIYELEYNYLVFSCALVYLWNSMKYSQTVNTMLSVCLAFQ